VIASFGFDILNNYDLPFIAQNPVLYGILFMFFGLSFPYMISKVGVIEKRQRAKIRSSQTQAASLNDALKQAVQRKELPASHLCSACEHFPIKDTHYQLCLECKQQYSGEIQRVRSQKYRARQAHMEATLTVGEWIQTLQHFHFLCAHCQKKRFTVMDHFIPIDKGGGTTKENCIPSCAKCNGRKSSTHPEA
jgi:5-methylcytosine-specific restriction endonuclease McrA